MATASSPVRPSTTRAALALLALAAIAGCADPVAAPPPAAAPLVADGAGALTVSVTELEFSGTAAAVAPNGRVAGSALVGGVRHAVVWDHGVLTDLGTAGGVSSEATGISLHGEVVGSRTASDGTTAAVLWANGDATVLPSLGGQFSAAAAISLVGDFIVGYSTLASVPEIHAALWHDGQVVDLGTLGEDSFASAVNERGQVVGTIADPHGFGNPYQQAVLWDRGVRTKLGTLGGPWSIASGINARGQVIGWSRIPASAHALHAFVWENGTMTDLGTLGGLDSYAYGINARGQIVGTSQTADFVAHAYLWDRGVITDLGTPEGATSSANAINENGRIIGAIDTQPVVWTVR